MNTKILALGDSWFHYPSHLSDAGDFPSANGVGNIIYFLFKENNLNIYFDETTTSEMYDGFTHNVKSIDDDLGCCGEELLIMVRDDEPSWLDLLRRRIQQYKYDNKKFIILLSGGGNDIADTYLKKYINDNTLPDGATIDDPLTLINEDALESQINGSMKNAFQKIFDFICSENLDNEFHFITHGYSYPPVNGSGVLHKDNSYLHNIYSSLFHKMYPGPWLQPTFIIKKIIDPANQDTTRKYAEIIINEFIDRFNDMLINVAANGTGYSNGFVHYVDLRAVPEGKNQDDQWCNELHFNRNNFQKAAKLFSEKINSI